MKNYLFKTKDRSPRTAKSSLWWTAIIASSLLLGWLYPVVPTAVSSVLLSPVHSVRVWIWESDHSLSLLLQDKQQLSERIQELEQTVAQQSGTSRSIARLVDENEMLRTLLDYEQDDRIAARVLERPNRLPYDVLQIDRGSRDGVVVDAPVFYGADQVVGFVFYTAPQYSLVTLVTTPRQIATAYVLGPNIYTTAEGVGGGMLRVRVPQGVGVDIGDLVILPAVSSGLFGEIVHIETTPTQPEQYGYVSLAVPLQSLRYVTVGEHPIRPASFTEVSETVERVRESLFRVDIPDDLQLATSTATSSVFDAVE